MKSKRLVKKKRVEKSPGIKEIYQSNFEYILQSKTFILIALGIFILFFLLGLFIPAPEIIQKEIFDLIKELSEKIKGLSSIDLIFYIFFNNLFASLFGLLLGTIFGIFSVTSSITNGYVLGFVASLSLKSQGILSLWRILPHGIFELPAIFLSLGLGLKLGFPFVYKYFKYYSHKKSILAVVLGILFLFPCILISAIADKKLRKYQLRDFKNRLNSSLSVFFFVIVPLLIVAAIIEGLLIFWLSNPL